MSQSCVQRMLNSQHELCAINHSFWWKIYDWMREWKQNHCGMAWMAVQKHNLMCFWRKHFENVSLLLVKATRQMRSWEWVFQFAIFVRHLRLHYYNLVKSMEQVLISIMPFERVQLLSYEHFQNGLAGVRFFIFSSVKSEIYAKFLSKWNRQIYAHWYEQCRTHHAT